LKSYKPQKIEDLLFVIRKCIANGNYRETFHAQLRKNQRGIILTDILHVLNTGRNEKSKDKFDDVFKTWNYAIIGNSTTGFKMRVIVSFDDEKKLLILTAFYLEKEGDL